MCNTWRRCSSLSPCNLWCSRRRSWTLSRCLQRRNRSRCKELSNKLLKLRWSVCSSNKRKSCRRCKCKVSCSRYSSSSNKSIIKLCLWTTKNRWKRNHRNSLCSLFNRKVSLLCKSGLLLMRHRHSHYLQIMWRRILIFCKSKTQLRRRCRQASHKLGWF